MPKHEPSVYFPFPTRVKGATLANPQPPEIRTLVPSGVDSTDAALFEFCTTTVGPCFVIFPCGKKYTACWP